MVNNQAKMVIEREDSWQRAIGMTPNFWRLSLIIKPSDCCQSLINHTDWRTFVLVKFAALSSYLMVNIKRFFPMNIFACVLCYRTEFPKLYSFVDQMGGRGYFCMSRGQVHAPSFICISPPLMEMEHVRLPLLMQVGMCTPAHRPLWAARFWTAHGSVVDRGLGAVDPCYRSCTTSSTVMQFLQTYLIH